MFLGTQMSGQCLTNLKRHRAHGKERLTSLKDQVQVNGTDSSTYRMVNNRKMTMGIRIHTMVQ